MCSTGMGRGDVRPREILAFVPLTVKIKWALWGIGIVLIVYVAVGAFVAALRGLIAML